MESTLGLVMTGGGARGAYQAGVLKRIGELKRVQSVGNPFPIVSGASAGAINSSAMAAGSDDFFLATSVTAALWSKVRPEDVFHCDILSQARNSLTWIKDLSFGGILGGGNARSLLDASPLQHFLAQHLRCERIQNNIRRGHLYALAISATNYTSGKSYLFIQGKKGHPMWNRARRVTLSTNITIDHVRASAAIPLVFQPVKLKLGRGSAFFGDGCVRLTQPLSPAIRLGATKLLAIGVRAEGIEQQKETSDNNNNHEPSLAEIMGVLLDAMFLDHLTSDVERLQRMNELLASGKFNQDHVEPCEKIRRLKTLLITPSQNVSQLARQHERDMPYLIHYFVSALGRNGNSCSDLMSYLLFTPEYTNALIDIGYKDADKRIDEIEDFIFSERTEAASA